MTVDTPSQGAGALQPYQDDAAGLEDIDSSDLFIPRIKIMHREGKFKNTLTGDEFPQLDCVILGLVKQRAMWFREVEDGDRPQCKSPDFEHGFPNLNESDRLEIRFPWNESNFSPEQAIAVVEGPSQSHPEGWNSNGHPVLPCGSCIFTQWGKSPSGKGVPPRCSEQHTYSMLYTTDGGESWEPALFTVQKSAISASKRYASSFAQARQPMFSVRTLITLNSQSRGQVVYATPVFTRGEVTDQGLWPEYANQARQVRSLIRSAPRGDEDDSVAVTTEATTESNPGANDPWAKPATPAPQAPPAPAQQAAPPPAPAAPPVPPPAQQAPTPPPADPTPPAPAPAPAPATPPPTPAAGTPAPPSTPATATPAVAAQDGDDDDDFPF